LVVLAGVERTWNFVEFLASSARKSTLHSQPPSASSSPDSTGDQAVEILAEIDRRWLALKVGDHGSWSAVGGLR
jgi:hypothetical protein